MSLSIIIPIYNEIDQLKFTVKKLLLLKKKISNFKVIFIDDFSNDNSYEKVLEVQKKFEFVSVCRSSVDETFTRKNFEFVFHVVRQ